MAKLSRELEGLKSDSREKIFVYNLSSESMIGNAFPSGACFPLFLLLLFVTLLQQVSVEKRMTTLTNSCALFETLYSRMKSSMIDLCLLCITLVESPA